MKPLKITSVKTGHSVSNRCTKVRLFVTPRNERLFDNLINRFHRPYALYKQDVIPDVLFQLGLDMNTKARWSQKAGCSCGCSPGFVLDVNTADTGFDTIWVMVK